MEEAAGFFAEIALRLHAESGSDNTIEKIAEYAKAAVTCDGSGVLLLHAQGRLESTAPTSDRVHAAERLQVESGEGPGLTVIAGGEDYVVVTDTAADARWPVWGPAAAELGLRSVISVRLATLSRTYGALTLYSDAPAGFDADDIAVAHIFARHASVAWAAAHSEDGLQQAVDARKLIGQAQGILMERFGVDADQAFLVLRRYSQDNNIKLRGVAEQVISTRRLPEP